MSEPPLLDPLLAELRRARPDAPDRPAGEPGAVALFERIISTKTGTRLELQTHAQKLAAPLHPRWRRPLMVTGAAAIGAAIAVPMVLTGGPTTGQGGPGRPGGSVLARLADVAVAQAAAVPPGPGQYQYTSSVEADQSCAVVGQAEYCALVPGQRQIWVGADGSGRIRETFGAIEFFTPAAKAAWQAAGSPPLGGSQTSDTTFGPHGLADGPSLAKAPTNPAELKAAIEDRSLEGGPPGAAADFTQIGDLLRETDASPALRSAAFQVASELPGIVQLGSVTDHDGRSGIGVAMDSHGVRNELIFAPGTSALMATQGVALVDSPDGYTGVKAGTLLDWTVYLSSGIVGSLDVTPTGNAVPPAPPVQPAPSAQSAPCTPVSASGTSAAPGTTGSPRPTKTICSRSD